jgi:hypothetical protein
VARHFGLPITPQGKKQDCFLALVIFNRLHRFMFYFLNYLFVADSRTGAADPSVSSPAGFR